MPATAASRAFMQELVAGHVLAMQCGARATVLLDRAAATPGRRDARADQEAVRLGALFSRLTQNVRRGFALTQAGRVPLAGTAPRAARPDLESPAPAPAKLHAAPDLRRGRLKNGNPAGDYLRAPRCGARTRAGCPCRQPAMKNGRCRMHGGLSTGPRTPEGLRRARTARLVHGYRTAELIGLRTRAVHAARRLRLLTTMPRSAGHGVHRSDSFCAGASSLPRTRSGGARPPSAPATTPTITPETSGACAARPSSGPSCSLSAGHGVDRPDWIFRRAAGR